MATSDDQKTGAPPRKRESDRRFSVSANRGAARHRIRYVEAGGASVDTRECTFCQSNPELDWTSDTRHQDSETSPGGGSGRAGAVEGD